MAEIINSKIMGNSKHVLCDIIYLDEINKIMVYNNDNGDSYTMFHYRKIDGILTEVNHWNLNNYNKTVNSTFIKRDYNLFLVQSGGKYTKTDSIYNYHEGKFIVEKGNFDMILFQYGIKNIDFLKVYKCFIGYFKLHSTKEDDDVIKYKNELTKEEVIYDFSKVSDLYFAFINIDGTIRDNKLLKGSKLSMITEIIDLNKYSSLDELKEEIIRQLDEEKNREKQKYLEIINKKNMVNSSLYLDEEVEKILKLK